MVRAFLPQKFPGNISTNSNFAPQSESSDTTPPPVFDFEVIEEVAAVFDNMIYNESGGGNDGQVAILGG